MDPDERMFLAGQAGGDDPSAPGNGGRAPGGPESSKPVNLDEWLRGEVRKLPRSVPPRIDVADRVATRLQSSLPLPLPDWNRRLLVMNVCLALSSLVAAMVAWPIVSRMTDPWVDLTLTMISR